MFLRGDRGIRARVSLGALVPSFVPVKKKNLVRTAYARESLCAVVPSFVLAKKYILLYLFNDRDKADVIVYQIIRAKYVKHVHPSRAHHNMQTHT